MKPLISVVIVSWNVSKSLNRCLHSIYATNYPNLEVIVVDNASTDDSARIIKSYPKAKYIQNTANIGFPKGVNIGLRQSRGDYLLILNPDARLPHDFFTKALEFYQKYPDAGLMGPQFIDPDNTPQGSVFPEPSVIDTFKEFWLGDRGLTQKYTPTVPNNQPLVVNAVSGACMFFPKSTLNKVGLLTERVFMYFEDMDFCRRTRAHNLKVYFNPQISIVHEHGQSAQQSSQASSWTGHLWTSSIWYNGALKHYLLWLISLSGQKLHSLFR